MKKGIIVVLCLTLLFLHFGQARAYDDTSYNVQRDQLAVNEDQSVKIKELSSQVKDLTSKVEELSSQIEASKSKTGESLSREEEPTFKKGEKEKEPWWKDRIVLYGDFRYRFELIKEAGNKLRNRHRIRARPGILVHITDSLDFNFRLATGNSDPVSTNQTLTGGFSNKSIWVNLAYIDWHPKFFKGFSVKGGKFKNPFYRVGKSELIWDSDLVPEGLNLSFARDFGSVNWFINTAGLWVQERSNSADSWLLGGQSGLKYSLLPDDKIYAMLGSGIYYYTHTKGEKPFYDVDNSFGNSVDANGNYTKNFREIEGFAELGGKIKNFPVSIFGNYVVNIGTNHNRQGWLAGAKLGKCKKPLSFSLRYNYRWLQKDAVIGMYTDSDFIGGGTNGSGHEVNFDFQIIKHVKFVASYFYNEKGLTNGHRYQRAQFDFEFKF